ncbi:MAG: hypothetical protein FD147_871 [Chloroflexi bacterium]|nr:MAG: hypothetical protein FD147_871 [Chloroflexota bacterium]
MKKWRLITTPAYSGAFNMALDEACLYFASHKQVPPTLRLYSWDPPSLSLGYAQKVTDVNITQLKSLGWQLVRRPTGGRAILHTDELTYSVSAPVDDPIVSGTLLESYQRISLALLTALKLLGLSDVANKQYPNQPDSAKTNPVCFEVPSNYEITASGKKLIGSAQARKSGGVLQHGSLPLCGDLTRITHALQYPSEEARQSASQKLLDHATSFENVAGRIIEWEQAAQAFIKAFSTTLDIEFYHSDPTTEELTMTEELVESKYGSDEWNFRN